MEKLNFKTTINAPVERVWKVMLGDKTYREWTKAFHAGSYFEGSWEKGSEMRFLGPDENGKLGGMFSRIKENIPNRFISIEHLGIIADGKVDTTSDEVKKWTPSLENYTFTDKNGKTELTVDMEIAAEYKEMMTEMWGRALADLKRICENGK